MDSYWFSDMFYGFSHIFPYFPMKYGRLPVSIFHESQSANPSGRSVDGHQSRWGNQGWHYSDPKNDGNPLLSCLDMENQVHIYDRKSWKMSES